jgi:hypothetical protein
MWRSCHTLSNIQLEEKAKRKHNRLNMMGLLTPPGTRSREHRLPEAPVWRPMTKTMFPDFLGVFRTMFAPWWKRKAIPPRDLP